MKTKFDKFDEKLKVIFESDKPQDIVIMGTCIGDRKDFGITDDYAGFGISINEKPTKHGLECDGFGTIVTAEFFIKNLSEIGWDWKTPTVEDFKEYGGEIHGCDFYLVKDFIGKITLAAFIKNYDSGKKIGFVPTINTTDEYLWYDKEWDQYKDNEDDDLDAEIYVNLY